MAEGRRSAARKFDPPILTEGPLSDRVYVVTHGKIIEREGAPNIVQASVKYEVTEQFDQLARARLARVHTGLLDA